MCLILLSSFSSFRAFVWVQKPIKSHQRAIIFRFRDIIIRDPFRWYGTPCNIFKDKRILKYYYNHGSKHIKINYICPISTFIKTNNRYKNETGARFEHATHKLLAYPSTDWATRKVIINCRNKIFNKKSIFIVHSK